MKEWLYSAEKKTPTQVAKGRHPLNLYRLCYDSQMNPASTPAPR